MYRTRIRLTGMILQTPDGRWVAEVTEVPGVMGYGPTPDLACEEATALTRRVLEDRLEGATSVPIVFVGQQKDS